MGDASRPRCAGCRARRRVRGVHAARRHTRPHGGHGHRDHDRDEAGGDTGAEVAQQAPVRGYDRRDLLHAARPARPHGRGRRLARPARRRRRRRGEARVRDRQRRGGGGRGGRRGARARAREYLGPKLGDVRLVALDQRGTGLQALECPELQAKMGASDLTPPKADEVTKCAAEVGAKRRFFTTADTVADYEALRQALGADTLALDGISYGTYVAQRYALAHPDRVSGLVLDSVVPSGGASLLSEVSIKATKRVLGEDTTRDLAKFIREPHTGPQMLDMLTSLSVGAPRGNGAAAAIHAASEGNPQGLESLQRGVQQVVTGWTASDLSQGLHASTLCADTPAPWGSAAAPAGGRKEQLEAAAAKLSDDDLYPYARGTATGNGIALQCLYWPPVRVPDPPAAAELPDVPTILLAGDRDLSTP